MWPFRRVPRPTGAYHDALLDLAGVVRRLREDHDALSAAHERLRGRFYSLKGVDPGGSELPKTKAEVLREFGVIPGKPVQHKG